MKKLFILALALCMSLVFAVAPAMAAGKLNNVQENFHFVTGYSNYGYAFAKIENSGDKPISVNAGVLEIYDAEGDVITSSDYMYSYVDVLQPGEYTYVQMYSRLEDDNAVAADYMMTLTGKSVSDSETLRLPVTTELAFGEQDGYWTRNYMYATVTNNTDETLFDISVVTVLLDEEGNILYLESDNLYSSRGLTPGSSMVIRTDVSSTWTDYYEANNLTPASVDAIAFVNK